MENIEQNINNNTVTEQTRVCRRCGRELPMSSYALYHGTPGHVCNDCRREKYNRTIKFNRKMAQTVAGDADPAYEGKTPRQIMDEITRAKQVLVKMGYNLEITCTYTETITHEIPL